MELTTTLEAELAAIAQSAEPGRTAQIAVRYWGWDGRGGATLETTGREFDGITASGSANCASDWPRSSAQARPRHPSWSVP